MALFGIKKTVGPRQLNAQDVIVPRSAMDMADDDPWQLVQAVISSVSFMIDDGLFKREEISARALQAFHADYYLTQIKNGGHAQFVANAYSNLALTVMDADIALGEMGARNHAYILRRMNQWIRDNPELASQQTGFEGGKAKDLSDLDDLFAELEKEAPLVKMSARWIKSWPELVVVDNELYMSSLQEIADKNPNRTERALASEIANIEFQFTSNLHASVALAASLAEPSEVLTAIHAGSTVQVLGKDAIEWKITTDRGNRSAIVSDDQIRILKSISDKSKNSPGKLQSEETMTVIGKVPASVSRDLVEKAGRYHAAPAIHLLMTKANLATDNIVLTPRYFDPKVHKDLKLLFTVVAPVGKMSVCIFEDSCILIDPGGTKNLATVDHMDVQAYLDKIQG